MAGQTTDVAGRSEHFVEAIERDVIAVAAELALELGGDLLVEVPGIVEERLREPEGSIVIHAPDTFGPAPQYIGHGVRWHPAR